MLSSADDCEPCPKGHSCSTGSVKPIACTAGTFASGLRTATCIGCDAGKFQDEQGQSACKDCSTGHYCARGAAAPLPCPAGTSTNATLLARNVSMTSEADCIVCGVGTFCPVGSQADSLCAPGTYNHLEKRKRCFSCEAGKYQDGEGKTACKACLAGRKDACR